MAEIAKPYLPLYLYRYRNFGEDSKNLAREIEALKAPYIYCSDFTKLNDPMEGYYRPSRILKEKEGYKKIVRAIHGGKSGVGIASLSDTSHNELMWTHYSGSYSGICVEYYAGRLIEALPSNVTLVRLGYDDDPPRISGKDARDVRSAARKILSQKKYNWAYEREWRLLGPIGPLQIEANNVIRRILIGSNINDYDRCELLKAFRKTQVDIYEMTIDGYDKDWKPIQGPKYDEKHRARRRRVLAG